jgi:hypothetical protein
MGLPEIITVLKGVVSVVTVRLYTLNSLPAAAARLARSSQLSSSCQGRLYGLSRQAVGDRPSQYKSLLPGHSPAAKLAVGPVLYSVRPLRACICALPTNPQAGEDSRLRWPLSCVHSVTKVFLTPPAEDEGECPMPTPLHAIHPLNCRLHPLPSKTSEI